MVNHQSYEEEKRKYESLISESLICEVRYEIHYLKMFAGIDLSLFVLSIKGAG